MYSNSSKFHVDQIVIFLGFGLKTFPQVLICSLFPSIHLCVTLLHTKEGVADKFLKDARECLEELLASPDAEAGGMVSHVLDCRKTVLDGKLS